MLGREHVAFGLASSAVVALAAYNPESPVFAYPVIVTGFAALGALVPDIDNPESLIGRFTLPISYLFNKIFGHRTITHDVSIIIPLFIVSLLVGNPIFFGIMFGVITHLFLDGFTKQGLCSSYFYTRFVKKKDPERFGRIGFLPYSLRMSSGGVMSKVTTYFFCMVFPVATSYLYTYFMGTGLYTVVENLVK